MKRFTATLVFMMLLGSILFTLTGCGENIFPDDNKEQKNNPYMFTNASSPLEVSENNVTYKISIQLLKDGYGLEGAEVRIQPFDRMYGIVTPSITETNIDGWAVFPYLPPENMEPVIGQSAVINAIYDDGNGSVIMKEIILDFKAPDVDPSAPCNKDGDVNTSCPLTKAK